MPCLAGPFILLPPQPLGRNSVRAFSKATWRQKGARCTWRRDQGLTGSPHLSSGTTSPVIRRNVGTVFLLRPSPPRTRGLKQCVRPRYSVICTVIRSIQLTRCCSYVPNICWYCSTRVTPYAQTLLPYHVYTLSFVVFIKGYTHGAPKWLFCDLCMVCHSLEKNGSSFVCYTPTTIRPLAILR